MNKTLTLADFLLARIAEDEQEARDALRVWNESPPLAGDLSEVPMLEMGYPDRALAECEAKRRIVEAFHDANQHAIDNENGLDAIFALGLSSAIRALAIPYADHPDYREEWKP